MAKVTVRLHGILKVIDNPFEMTGNTVPEIVRGLVGYIKRVYPELVGVEENRLKLQVRGYDTAEDMEKPLEEGQVLDIMPAMSVGKKGGFFQIILGAVLIVAGLVVGLGNPIGAALFVSGVTSVLGGTLMLLTPAPRLDTQPEDTNPEASKYISGSGNTTKHGTRIAIGGGKFPQWGQFLSINIQSRDISSGAAETYTYGNTTTGSSGGVVPYRWDGYLNEF